MAEGIVSRENWVTPQSMIDVSTRYDLLCVPMSAVVRQSMMARIALNGAWAVRVGMNRPLFDSRLKGGIEEVNLRLERYVTENDNLN